MAMSEEEWLQCSKTNPMLAAMEPPSEERLAEFNLACCRRIRHFLTDDITLQALEALELAGDQATAPAELAQAVNELAWTYIAPSSPLYDPSRNTAAAQAVGLAVCRSLPPGSFHYWSDAVDCSRLVAVYCQSAVGWAADPDRDADAEDYEGADDGAEPGLTWIRQRAEQAEASIHCDLIRSLFTRRIEPGSSCDT